MSLSVNMRIHDTGADVIILLECSMCGGFVGSFLVVAVAILFVVKSVEYTRYHIVSHDFDFYLCSGLRALKEWVHDP